MVLVIFKIISSIFLLRNLIKIWKVEDYLMCTKTKQKQDRLIKHCCYAVSLIMSITQRLRATCPESSTVNMASRSRNCRWGTQLPEVLSLCRLAWKTLCVKSWFPFHLGGRSLGLKTSAHGKQPGLYSSSKMLLPLLIYDSCSPLCSIRTSIVLPQSPMVSLVASSYQFTVLYFPVYSIFVPTN